jgi:hypothetical protein
MFFFVFILSIFFIGCGGGGGSSAPVVDPDPVTPPTNPVIPPSSSTISGKVVDNYIENATVCIDSNKNNVCDAGELSTTSASDGSFSFTSTSINSTDVVIAYGGTDATTDEAFNYIVKNTVANKDSNGKVILSSINTLIVDYMDVASEDLTDATIAVVNFLGSSSSNIESSNAITDVVANKSSQSDEFEKSLKLFQMVAAINDVNDSINSAKSFNDLAKYIKDNNTKTDDDNISLTNYNSVAKTINANQYTPVVLENNTWNYYVDMSPSNEYNFDAYDPSGRTLTYSILGADNDDFNISANGTISFKITPAYTNPTDNDFDGEYKIDVNISNNDTYIIKELTVNVIKYNKSVVPVLNSSSFSIEDNASINSILGAITVSNSGSLDSEIIKYELNTTTYFDINRSTGNIFVNNSLLPDLNVSSGNSMEYNISVRAKNSAGWSSPYISTITIFDAGELNTTATIQNETFETIYENNASTQEVGTVTIAQNGGHAVDDYNITSGNGSGYFAISSTGEINATNSFDYEGQDTYTIGVKAYNNANGWGSEATITIKIKDVNEAPSMTPAVETQTVSLGESIQRTYTLNDGDSTSGVTQTISINVSSSDSNVSVSNSISSGVDGDNLVITLTGNTVGRSLIRVELDDNSGTVNGGIEVKTYEFNTTVRSNGWKIYDNRKQAANNTVHDVVFDTRTYTWNPTKQWYEDNTYNTILMPVQILKSARSAYLAGNFNEVQEGHYYVNKADYLWDVNKSQTHIATSKYRNASGNENNITAKNDNFQHDAYHNFFVSMVTRNDSGDVVSRTYENWTNATINFVDANDSNMSYATAENFSAYFVKTLDEIKYVDTNNTNDVNTTECAKMYGIGWRIPTAYEMGLKTDDKDTISPMTGSGNGFIPSYVGDSLNMSIFSSSQFGSDNKMVTLELVDEYEDGLWGYRTASGGSAQDEHIRCIYQP